MTKEKILKIASQEFSKYGYDGVSMNNLADKLEVNKATIYYHFKDKKALYQEVIKSMIKDNREEIEDTINSKLHPKEKFKLYIKTVIGKFKNNPDIIGITLREFANYGSNIDETITPEIEQEMRYLKDVLSELELKEKYKETDSHLIKAMIMGTASTYYSMQMCDLEFKELKNFNKNSDYIFDYLSDTISSLILDAICKN